MTRNGICHHHLSETAEMTSRLVPKMLPLLLLALIFITVMMMEIHPIRAEAVLKGEQNLLNLLNSESSMMREIENTNSPLHHLPRRRRILLEDLNMFNHKRSLMREDGSSVLSFFEKNPFVSERNAWIQKFQSSSSSPNERSMKVSDNEIHVLVTFKTNKDSREYEKILSTPMGENTFTSRVNVQQLKRFVFCVVIVIVLDYWAVVNYTIYVILQRSNNSWQC